MFNLLTVFLAQAHQSMQGMVMTWKLICLPTLSTMLDAKQEK